MTRDEALRTLGLDPQADQEDIRHQYRCLCLDLHPDRFQNPAEKTRAADAFRKVRDAYEFFKRNRGLFRAAQASPVAVLRRDARAPVERGETWRAPRTVQLRMVVLVMLGTAALALAWFSWVRGLGGPR